MDYHLKKKVFESLDNAAENIHGFLNWHIDDMIEDICITRDMYVTDYVSLAKLRSELRSIVQEWLDKKLDES